VTALDLDTTYSVSFWMKLDSMPSASARSAAYMMYGTNTASPAGASQRLYIPGLEGYVDRPLFISRNTASVDAQITTAGSISDSTWYNIVILQRGHNDTLQIYVNNVKYATAGGEIVFTGTVGGTDDALRFGNSGAGSSSYLDGILDEIGIWKRELTPVEVGQLYNGGLGKTHPFN
jgi:hypothetical protein